MTGWVEDQGNVAKRGFETKCCKTDCIRSVNLIDVFYTFICSPISENNLDIIDFSAIRTN